VNRRVSTSPSHAVSISRMVSTSGTKSNAQATMKTTRIQPLRAAR
jgi:hypothetical protein